MDTDQRTNFFMTSLFDIISSKLISQRINIDSYLAELNQQFKTPNSKKFKLCLILKYFDVEKDKIVEACNMGKTQLRVYSNKQIVHLKHLLGLIPGCNPKNSNEKNIEILMGTFKAAQDFGLGV